MKLRCLKILNFDYDNIARMVKMLNKVKECNKEKRKEKLFFAVIFLVTNQHPLLRKCLLADRTDFSEF